MSIKSILITETEKKLIKEMYGILTEEDLKPIRIRHKDKSRYDVNSTDPKNFIDKFVNDLVTKIDATPGGKQMRDSGKMTIVSLLTQTGASNHWGGKPTGYDFENNLTTPAASKIETELYDKNKDLSKRRGDDFNKLLQTKLGKFGIKFSPQTKIATSADVINTGGKNDDQKDSTKYPNNGQYVGLTLSLQYADKITTQATPPTKVDITSFQSWKDIKSDHIITGSYFCDGTNSEKRESAADTYESVCSKLPVNLRNHDHISAFEIKWGPNVIGATYTIPVARWMFTWGADNKITSIYRKQYNKKYPVDQSLPEQQVTLDDPTLKFFMGISEGQTATGGERYKKYVLPFIKKL